MKIVILGNGISGITAARFIRKRSNHEIVVISDESDEFFSRTALMYIYMGHMRERDTRPYEPWFWDKNSIQRLRARIARIDFSKKTLHTTGGKTVAYDKLVLAAGSRSNKFGWPGQDLNGVQGLYHLQDLAAMEQFCPRPEGLGEEPDLSGTNVSNDSKSADAANQVTISSQAISSQAISSQAISSQAFSAQAFRPGKAVIVGGGLIGVEMAEMLHSRQIPVTFLVREKDFWGNVLPPEEAAMVSRHLREHHIDLRLQTELREILDDGQGHCRAVITQAGETIACGFVGLTVGVSPNIEFLKNSSLETNQGILVNDYLETNLPDVYAVGDCAELRQPQPGRRSIEAIWYTGRMMGETLAHNLTGNRMAYNPGIWFNSAKFFDIEYQVYGDIRAVLPPEQASLYWEHANGKKSIRLNYEKTTGRILGFNLMGVRYRQEVCERWLRAGAHIETVLPHLGLANFDPEFSAQYEAFLIAKYNRQNGTNLRLQQKRGLPAVLNFLTPAVRR
ncbi:MAG: NAD(P)/FAD-dependent oxidoreductase [Saprospiraceae bacterium]|nr:NAD(P)/FAD-dependent oxidoreductase [Saprospiraceae bacterium]